MNETTTEQLIAEQSPKKFPLFRRLTSHQVNPANDLLDIIAADVPGSGGANHAYIVYWPNSRAGIESRRIEFQNGPIAEAGVNGFTHEALLAIIEDRLTSFQKGSFACAENGEALQHVQSAMAALKSRTLKRMARGVEGTYQK